MTSASPVLTEDGYTIAAGLLDLQQVTSLHQALQEVPLDNAGTRNLLDLDWCRDLAVKIKCHRAVQRHLPTLPVAIQCTLFDKTEQKNWLVALHQDLSVPVKEPVQHPSLGVWSLKEGQHYVQAPSELLEKLVAVRLHLDDCGPENGPLRVVPHSHIQGRLDSVAAQRVRSKQVEVVCTLSKGDALLFRPLLLHASSKAKSPSRRRVLHFLFAPAAPGYGLRWQHAV
jgi:ectoine hydroxylase-related dioxygenase (phytanoyl-CoA dioxygenase family)